MVNPLASGAVRYASTALVSCSFRCEKFQKACSMAAPCSSVTSTCRSIVVQSNFHDSSPFSRSPTPPSAVSTSADDRGLAFRPNEDASVSLPLLSTADSSVGDSNKAYDAKLLWFATSAEEEQMLLDRTLNIILVASAVTVAVTKVFTIDNDHSRGWTLLEIIRNAPLHNWMAYEAMLQTNPVLAKMMISGVVYTVGDWIAQCVEGVPVLEFDRARMARSGAVGFLLHGSLSHYYYHFCEWLFPFQAWWVVPLKIGFDQTAWSAVWNSIYFVAIAVMRRERPSLIFKEWKETFFPLLTAGWKLWPFAHVVTYGFVPVEQRLLWVDMVELIWVTILSLMSNENAEGRKISESESNHSVITLVDKEEHEE